MGEVKFMEKNNIPEYLYHYTSIDKLALILKNRTIRLNSLNKMDDLQEQKTADVKNIGRFIFVSSWTSDSEESIPMWKMYTNPLSGVRIRMKTNPFLRQGTKGIDLQKKTSFKPVDQYTLNHEVDTFLDLSELLRQKIFSPQAWGGNILNPVEYTNDISFLEPKIINRTADGIELNLGIAGKYKNMGWSFQKEWRYIMIFIKWPLNMDMNTSKLEITQILRNICNGTEPAPIEYFDLSIEPSCFEDMQITASPQLTAGNRVLLETLVEKYNPKAKLLESQYTGLL